MERKRGKHRTETRHSGILFFLTDNWKYGKDNCTSGTEKGRFGTEKGPLGVEIGLWGGAGGPSGSPRGPGRGLGVPWEALGESQGGFSDTRRSLWGPRGVRLNFRGASGGPRGATVNQGGFGGLVLGHWSNSKHQQNRCCFMYIFAMGGFPEGSLNGPQK